MTSVEWIKDVDEILAWMKGSPIQVRVQSSRCSHMGVWYKMNTRSARMPSFLQGFKHQSSHSKSRLFSTKYPSLHVGSRTLAASLRRSYTTPQASVLHGRFLWWLQILGRSIRLPCISLVPKDRVGTSTLNFNGLLASLERKETVLA